jgi:hypothetical protein
VSRFKSHEQPLCRCCGKPIRKWTTHVHIVPERTKYNSGDSSWSRTVVSATPLKTKADCQRHSNQQVVSIKYTVDYDNSYPAQPIPETRRVYSFTEWDGESYDDELFCNNACAQELGRLAARNNKLQTVAYVAAIKRRREKKAATG